MDNELDNYDNSELKYLVTHNQVRRFRRIMKNERNTYFYDTKFEYLMAYSIQYNNLNFVKLLIHYGIDMNGSDPRNRKMTFVVMCVEYERYDILKYLLKHDASLSHDDNYGYCVCMMAFTMRNIEIFKLLVKYNASIDCIDLASQKSILQLTIEKRANTFRDVLLNAGVETMYVLGDK